MDIKERKMLEYMNIVMSHFNECRMVSYIQRKSVLQVFKLNYEQVSLLVYTQYLITIYRPNIFILASSKTLWDIEFIS